MPLSFEELSALLQPQDGALDVAAGQFGAGPPADLFTAWFTDATLALTGAASVPDPGNQRVSVTGTLKPQTFLGLAQATLTSGEFRRAEDGTVTATLAISVGDGGWTLSSSFPVLKGSVCDSLTWADAVFTLASDGAPTLPEDFRSSLGYPPEDPFVGRHLLPGLSLAATVDLAASLAAKVADLVATPLALTGPIEAYPHAAAAPADGGAAVAAPGDGAGPTLYPQLLLTPPAGAQPRAVVVEGQSFAVAPRLACVLAEVPAADDSDVTATANAVLALAVTWTGAGGLPPLELRGSVSGPAAATLELETGGPPLVPVGGDELGALLGGADVAALLHPGHGFPVYQGLTLQRVAVTLGLQPLSFDGATALLTLAADAGAPDPTWSLFGGLVTVHGLTFDAGVTRAGGALTPAVVVSGTADLGGSSGVTLTAAVGLPALAFRGDLAETAQVDLTDLVKSRLGVEIPLPDITGATLTVTGDVSASTWSLDTSVVQSWALLGTPPQAVTLDTITLHLAGGPGNAVGGSLTADLHAGEAPLEASATYAKADGWLVHAGLAPGQQADLAAVAVAVAAAAGLPITASLPSVVLSVLSVDYRSAGPELDVHVAPADTGTSLLQQLGRAVTGIADLPAIGISEIQGTFARKDTGTAVTLHVAATDWSIPLGPATLAVTGVAADLTHNPPAGPEGSSAAQPEAPAEPPAAPGGGAGGDAGAGGQAGAGGAAGAGGGAGAGAEAGAGGESAPPRPGTSGTITGTLALAGVTTTVNWTLPGALRVTGEFPAVRLTDLVATLSGNGLQVPAPLDVTLPSSTLELTEDGGDFSLSWRTAATPLGELALEVRRSATGGRWGIAAGFALPGGWKLSSLSPELSVLDGLVFESAALVLSSFADPAFSFADLPLPALGTGVVEGLTFGCRLTLSGALAGVGTMLGRTTVDVTAQIGPSPGSTKLVAALGGTVAIPPTTNLLLGDLALSITAQPLGASVSGSLTIPIGDQTLVATGRFSITETAADFALDVTGTALSLAAPMGFRGVVLDEIGVVAGITFEPPGLNLGLAGAFHLGSGTVASDKFAFAFTIEGEAVTPTLLSAHLDELDLPTIFDACLLPTAVLPAALTQVSFSDLTIYWCDTEQPLPDGTVAQPGYGFSGAMAVFGWHAKVKLLLNFAVGVHGEASCDPVDLANGALTLTGNGVTGGPHVLVDTAASPYFDVSLDAKLLDIVGVDVQGQLTSTGLTFTLTNHLGVLDASLAITASPTHASLASGVNFFLDVVVGPLDVPGTTLTLGQMHVQAGFTGAITMSLDSGGFRATVDGGFIWQGQHWQLATLTLTVTPADVEHIAQAVAQAVRDQASTLFGELLSDANRYFGLVSAGLVTGGSDAGTLATGVYHLTADEAQALFKQVDLRVNSTVHTDVATGHGDTAPHTDVASQHADVPASHVDTPGAHTDVRSTHVDVPGTHADTSHHIDTPSVHTDFSFFGHTDTNIPPHGDTNPHVDQTTTPHVDSSTPHTDFAPHIDQTATPHVDTNSPHVDTAPHVDVNPHVDDATHVDA